MGKRRRPAPRPRAVAPVAVARSLAPQASAIHFGGSSPFFATQESSSRGRLLVFPEDTRKMLTSGTLSSLRLVSRTLVANYGPAAALDYLSWMVGPLKPQSVSGDDTWSALAEERFNLITGTPSLFDAAGKFTFSQAQTSMCLLHRWVDGDAFSIFTESRAGNGCVAMREGHRVGQPPEPDSTWNNGVQFASDGMVQRYHFKGQDQKNGKSLPASAVMHHARFFPLGTVRGTPALAHALNHFRDIIETNGFVKQAIKQAALMGITRRADVVGNNLANVQGLGASLNTDVFLPPDYTGGVAPPAEKKLSVEDVLSGGLVSTVPLDVLHDDRPHPNQREFKDALLREAAIGLGVAPEVLFFMDAPGGADIRFKIEVLARFIAMNHRDHVLPFAQRLWTYIIGKEMEEARLPYPSKGDFWRVRWTPQRDISVDLGKTGRLMIELRKTLMMSFARYFESLSYEWEDELEQIAKEERRLIDLETKYNLPPGRLTEKLASTSSATFSHAPESGD